MSVKIYNKLVRDKIPEIISSKSGTPTTRVLSDSGYRLHLKLKLVEESTEAVEASSNEAILGELADLNEVLESLMAQQGLTIVDLRAAQAKKRAERGGFEKKLLLEKVDEN